MRIIEAQERSSIDIPISELLDDGGQLKLRPDLIGRGLVEVKQSKSGFKLQINGLVGRLPITENLSLDISPKFPVGNLNRMVYASQVQLFNPFLAERPYEETALNDYLPVPLILSFEKSMLRLVENGILREYQRVRVEGPPKPRIDFNKTQQKFWAKLKPTSAVMEQFDFSQDNLTNQCLKLATVKAVSISRGSPHLSSCIKVFAQSLRQLSNVSLRDIGVIRRELSYASGKVPAFRRDYAKALEQAFKIIHSTDVSLNSSSNGIALESFIISLDDVFEQYLRAVLSELPTLGFGRVATVDGNLPRHQRPLFADNKKYKTKPDLIVQDQRGALMIGDAKYKMKPSEEDRYQIISHALSYGVKQVVLIYPKHTKMPEGGLKRLGKIGGDDGIEVFEYYLDLSGDLLTSEKNLRIAFAELLN